MTKFKTVLSAATVLAMLAACSMAQSAYEVISVNDGGTITGTVKWSGAVPKMAPVPINKDVEVCDPQAQKKRDLERLIVNTNGGVANTVVFLKNITKGKAMDLPETRQALNQKTCRYEPHVLLVPDKGTVHLRSSDPILHTVHMSGASDYNLPFPFANQTITRTMNRQGLVDLRCNAGHVWMNAEMMVVSHPYYTVTDEDGNFRLTGVPPGEYQIEAWHEGWKVVGQGTLYDVMTQVRVQRPIFSEPMEWTKKVTVPSNGTATVNFMMSERRPELASN
jgi:Carboxypeptidase regulatory-like domain